MEGSKTMLTVKEISEMLGISQSTVRKMVREKKIPFNKILSKILFDKKTVDDWLKRNTVTEIE